MNDQIRDLRPGIDAARHAPGMSPRDDDEVDVRELLDLLWSGRWLILTVAVLVTAIGVAYALLAAPVYEADGLVQVEEEKQGLSSTLSQLTSVLGGSPVQAPAEIAILRSRMVLGAVIEQLKLRIDARPRYFPVLGEAIARRRSDLEAPAEPIMGLESFAWGGERIVVTTFDVPRALEDAQFTLIAAENNGFELLDPEDRLVGKGTIGEPFQAPTSEGPITLFVQELVARPRTEFRLAQLAVQTVLKSVSERLVVEEQAKDSGIIRVSYSGADPVAVASVVNAVEQEYLRQNVERRSEEAQQSLEFLKKQLPDIKAKVDQAQRSLNAYQSKEGSADVQKETELVLDQAVSLETQKLQLQQEREAASQRYTAQHPVIVTLTEQIRSLDAALAKLRGQVESLPQKQQEIFGLMRDLEINQGLYTAMLNSVQELQITKAGTIGNVRIIDAALPPLKPSEPRKALTVALAAVLGVVLGVAAVALRRMLIRGVDRPEDVERVVGIPTYASIPYSRSQRIVQGQLGQKDRAHAVLAAINSGDVAIEALRSLRTALHFAMLEARNNIIMFTGPTPALGKSFVSLNLAAVLAQAGHRVVVIDADLRRGRLHRYFQWGAAPGVADLVTGQCSVEQAVRATPIENLSVVPSGSKPPNPAEILLHEDFGALLGKLSSQFDYVIVDTPPVLPVADAAIVGALAGTTFVVLKSGEHPMRAIQETVRRLQRTGLEVKGVIFNQVGMKIGSYGYGSYGASYGYSAYGYGSDRK